MQSFVHTHTITNVAYKSPSASVSFSIIYFNIIVFLTILSSVVIGIALPFIVRVFVVIGGQIFSGHLRAVLPISGINGLSKGTEFMEGVRFADVGDFILDVGQKSAIQLLVEGGVTPLYLGSKAVEVNKVLHNVPVITHVKIFKVSFGFAVRVVWSKIIF